MGKKVKNVGRHVRVLIEQTGVETVVSEEYYETYKNEGVRFIGEYDFTDPDRDKEQEESSGLSYAELKDALTLKGATFKGNASKKELEAQLKELEEGKEEEGE